MDPPGSTEQDPGYCDLRRITVVVSIQEADVRGYAIGDRVSQLQYGTGTTSSTTRSSTSTSTGFGASPRRW